MYVYIIKSYLWVKNDTNECNSSLLSALVASLRLQGSRTNNPINIIIVVVI